MKAKPKSDVLWFESLRSTDVPIVGGKNVNLGEMIHAGISVSPEFAVAARAYEKHRKETGIIKKIDKISARCSYVNE